MSITGTQSFREPNSYIPTNQPDNQSDLRKQILSALDEADGIVEQFVPLMVKIVNAKIDEVVLDGQLDVLAEAYWATTAVSLRRNEHYDAQEAIQAIMDRINPPEVQLKNGDKA
jgi:hypothetical protein